RELRTISNQLLPEEYAVIEKAARTPFTRDGSPDEAGKRLQREFGIPKALAPEVLKAVHLPENPGEMTVWGVVNGITSVAKGMAYAEGKTQLASVAGELLANAK
ncbi:MAG: hypothetical protein L6R43_00470, partial [Planctomycetes bacterium]|nr:hypothetical protein [Planctomycetota bacterium]